MHHVVECFRITFICVFLLLFNSHPGHGQYTFDGLLPNTFANANGIAVGDDGKIYISDVQTNKIQVFNADRSFAFAFGSPGPGNGQFNYPVSVAVDDQNNVIYVSDRLNHRVQKFSKDGSFIAIIGGLDETGNYTGDGKFILTSGIDVDGEGNLYVCDAHKVQKFNSDGIFLAKIAEMNQPTDVAVDHHGNIFIAHWSGQRILKTSPSGAVLADISVKYASGIDVNGAGQVFASLLTYVCCTYEIRKFANDLTLIHSFGTTGTEPGQLEQPSDVAIDVNDNIFITDKTRVQIFKPYATPKIAVSYNGQQIENNSIHPFGATSYGNPIDHIFEISNKDGVGELLLSELSLPNGFALVGAFPQTLSHGAKVMFKLRATASTVGHFDGLVKFKTNDADAQWWQIAVNNLVSRAPQTITFDSIPDYSIGESPITLFATASSGLPVTFNLKAGPATLLTPNRLSFYRAGGVTIEAIQEGNQNYLPATSKQRYFEVLLILAGENTASKSISIYPNPVKNKVIIKSVLDVYQIILYDMMGQELKSLTNGGPEQILDLSNLSDGTYILKCKSGYETSTQKLVVRQ